MKIENQKLNIEEAFSQNFYYIPDYQREYIWKEKNVSQLLEDITEEYESNPTSEYFIGSIVVTRKGISEYEVIDGQQRLTTIFLCLCAFRELLAKNTDYKEILGKMLFSKKMDLNGQLSESYHLILQYEDSIGLMHNIINKVNNNSYRNSAKRIKEAYNCILEYLNKDKDIDSLIKFLGYFNNKVNFIQIETVSISDALKTFETINERGIGLDPMDLLKNLIFRQLERQEFSKLKAEWQHITDHLDKAKEKKLRFLRYFIMAHYEINDAKKTGVLREDEIYNWIVKNDYQCNYTKTPFAFIHKITENVEAYVKFSKQQDYLGNKNVYLENIKSLGGNSFSQHLLVLLPAKNFSEEAFNLLAQNIENLIFYYTITRTSTKDFERAFAKWAKKINEINKYSKTEQIKQVEEFVKTEIDKEKERKRADFKPNFLNLRLDSLQTYKIKYILAKIAQYVDQQRIGQTAPSSLESYLASKMEIEHILPNHPKQELIDLFGSDLEYQEYKLKLGNLTLLEKPINIVAGREFFTDKKEKYMQSQIYLTKSLAKFDEVGRNTSVTRINQKLFNCAQWDKNAIDQRQKILFDLAKEIWG